MRTYLPKKEVLGPSWTKIHSDTTKGGWMCKQWQAVKTGWLVMVAILLEKFQRSGNITNATIIQCEERTDGIIRVKKHKSR